MPLRAPALALAAPEGPPSALPPPPPPPLDLLAMDPACLIAPDAASPAPPITAPATAAPDTPPAGATIGAMKRMSAGSAMSAMSMSAIPVSTAQMPCPSFANRSVPMRRNAAA